MQESRHNIILSFGSNLGEKKENIQKAYHLLQEHLGDMLKCSSFYETKPWGFESSTYFVNSCALFSTLYNPFYCLKIINNIERQLGRQRSYLAGYEDRIIDIDIIFYDQESIHTPELQIPHPLWQVRDFVINPLKEILPNLVIPLLKS